MTSNAAPASARPTVPRRRLLAIVVAGTIGLAGTVGGGPRAALGADPTVAPSVSPAPTAIPTPTPTPTATPTATATPTTVLGSTVTFFGRGYGHGVGMSQYGARGRALAGQNAATILAHYYRGTTLGTLATTTRIRVRILWSWTASPTIPLTVYGRLAPWTIDGIGATFPIDAVLRVIPTTTDLPGGPRTTWRLRVASATGAVLYAGPKPASLVVRGAAGNSRLQLWSKPSAYDQYRGILRITASSTFPTVIVVNELPLETYLRGVVPAEMPSTWPAAALKAQSIAARSYAARHLRPSVYYDVVDTSASQVYRGALGERATTNATIGATAGVVLKSGSAIANTLFHSTGGGATENNENVFTSSTGVKVAGVVSYLRGSSDRDAGGRSYDAEAPYATWATRTYTRDQLSAWFAVDPRTNVGSLTAIDLRDRGVSGRLISVTLIGSAGSKKVSGAVFRSVFNAGRPSADPMLRSTLFATAPIP
jgi:stage II sporulation protein D